MSGFFFFKKGSKKWWPIHIWLFLYAFFLPIFGFFRDLWDFFGFVGFLRFFGINGNFWVIYGILLGIYGILGDFWGIIYLVTHNLIFVSDIVKRFVSDSIMCYKLQERLAFGHTRNRAVMNIPTC